MAYGNQNIADAPITHLLTVDTNSDTITLSGKAKAVTLLAAVAMWVNVGPGTPTAAIPNDKGSGGSRYLAANVPVLQRVSGTDEAPWKVAAIVASTGGNLHITEHHDF